MNVRNLIQALEQFPDDLEVHFAYNYGDRWHTMVAPVVDEVNESAVVHSTYHNMPKIMEDAPDHEDDAVKKVVVLSE